MLAVGMVSSPGHDRGWKKSSSSAAALTSRAFGVCEINFLSNRIGKLLLLRCASSFSYNILTNNTNLLQNLNLTNTQSALFIFDGFKWKKIF